MLERFKEIPQVERMRLEREGKARDGEKMPPKASPFHNATHDKDMEKIDRQGEINEKISIEKEKSKPKPTSPQGGRPQNKQDTNKRKKRVDTPKSRPGLAELASWTINTYEAFDVISKGYLEFVGKKNKRQLTKSEVQEIADIKLRVLASLPPLANVDHKLIHEALADNEPLPSSLREMLSTSGISTENRALDDYESTVIGMFISYTVESCPLEIDEN